MFTNNRQSLNLYFGTEENVDLVIPSSCTSIGGLTFAEKSINTLIFSDNENLVIGDLCFSGSKLKSISFPSGLKSLFSHLSLSITLRSRLSQTFVSRTAYFWTLSAFHQLLSASASMHSATAILSVTLVLTALISWTSASMPFTEAAFHHVVLNQHSKASTSTHSKRAIWHLLPFLATLSNMSVSSHALILNLLHLAKVLLLSQTTVLFHKKMKTIILIFALKIYGETLVSPREAWNPSFQLQIFI